jgi:hypothetical protein
MKLNRIASLMCVMAFLAMQTNCRSSESIGMQHRYKFPSMRPPTHISDCTTEVSMHGGSMSSDIQTRTIIVPQSLSILVLIYKHEISTNMRGGAAGIHPFNPGKGS